MQMKMYLALALVVTLLIGQGSVYGEVPLGNEFTYQGQLKEGGIPADGDYDFIFRLFDDPVGGTQVGGDVEIDGWPVSDGLFTVELDFGTDVFTGDARWIEVGVREGGGGGAYTTLSPRQPLNAAPYALYALNGPGSGGYWTLNGDHIYNNNPGCVGIGTSNPSALLTLGDAAHKIQFERGGLETWSVYQTTTGDHGLGFYNEDDSDYCMFLSEAGCVGIGTVSPLDRLTVAGASPGLRLQDDDNAESYTSIYDQTSGMMRVDKLAGSGAALMDLNPRPLDGVSDATVRFFRRTNTSGPKAVVFNRGDNTTGASAMIGAGGLDSWFQADGGNFGIGTTTPGAPLTVNGLVWCLSGGYKFPDGTVQSTAANGGSGYWSANGNDIYNNNGGYVGIGTSSPSSTLHVKDTGSGDPSPATRIGLQWFQPMDQNDWCSLEVGGMGEGTGSSPRLVREAGTALYFQTEDTMNSVSRTTQMTLDPDGNLGIGTTEPAALLEAVSTAGVNGIRSTTSAIPVAAFRTSTAGSWPAIHAESASSGSDATGIRSYLTSASPGTGSAAILGCVNGATMSGYGVHGSHAGYGIGVYGDSVNGTGVYAKSTNGWALYAETENGATAARFVGNVEILSPSTQQILIEFGEGLDYAEGFDVSDENAITPGTVLVIDTENAGQLAISNAPYDRKVAGIVAGAQGLGSAVRLGAGQYDFDVALAGRVYCNVDASYGAVQPGDLLTTSPTPGYAMRVTDRQKAQGAILGKAMQPLEQGEQGQILVLVTLQ